MIGLELELAEGRPWWLPGSTVEGTARWRLAEEPEAVELRLIWHTSGKGTRDVELVDSRRLDRPGAVGEHRFGFRLPEGPYSFSGTLVSLGWSVEVVVSPGEESARADLVVSPTPVEVLLRPVEEP